MKTTTIIILGLSIVALVAGSKITDLENHVNHTDSIFHFKDSVHDANLMQIVKYLKSKENK